MTPIVGWGLAVLAVAVGYWSYGWKGVVLAVTVIVFWLLLQFSRALRVMRNAGQRPIGEIDSAVMLQARLKRGMTLMDVIQLTHSLGQRTGESPEAWTWTDPGGVQVVLTLQDARLVRWELVRPPE